MKSITTIFIFLICSIVVFSQNDTIWIKNNGFVIKIDNETDDDLFEVEYLSISSIDSLNNNKIKHILKKIIGDCNSLSIEIGDYEVKNNQIILYSFWCWKGDAPVSPWGARKQIFTLSENNKLGMSNSCLYIESGRSGWPENKGVEFLYKKPKTQSDLNDYTDYVKKMESQYNANFVFGKNSDDLMIEVKNRFKDYLLSLKKTWGKSNNPFGFKI